MINIPIPLSLVSSCYDSKRFVVFCHDLRENSHMHISSFYQLAYLFISFISQFIFTFTLQQYLAGQNQIMVLTRNTIYRLCEMVKPPKMYSFKCEIQEVEEESAGTEM